jgi:hypothetical protein
MAMHDMALVAVVFWLFVAAVAIIPIVGSYKLRQSAMDSIRSAIDRGQELSPDVVQQLTHMGEFKDQKMASVNLKIGGVIVMASGIGTGLVATVFLFVIPIASPYVYAGAVLAFSIGAGLYWASKVMRQHELEEKAANSKV